MEFKEDYFEIQEWYSPQLFSLSNICSGSPVVTPPPRVHGLDEEWTLDMIRLLGIVSSMIKMHKSNDLKQKYEKYVQSHRESTLILTSDFQGRPKAKSLKPSILFNVADKFLAPLQSQTSDQTIRSCMNLSFTSLTDIFFPRFVSDFGF